MDVIDFVAVEFRHSREHEAGFIGRRLITVRCTLGVVCYALRVHPRVAEHLVVIRLQQSVNTW